MSQGAVLQGYTHMKRAWAGPHSSTSIDIFSIELSAGYLGRSSRKA